jgi:hypothetical protein
MPAHGAALAIGWNRTIVSCNPALADLLRLAPCWRRA